MSTKKRQAKTAARKSRDPLAGRAPDVQLYRGVRRYVESGKGSVLVIGGIEIQQWPGEGTNVYRVAIKVMGRKPTFPKPEPIDVRVR